MGYLVRGLIGRHLEADVDAAASPVEVGEHGALPLGTAHHQRLHPAHTGFKI